MKKSNFIGTIVAHLLHGFDFHSFRYLWLVTLWKQTFLLKYCQKVNIVLTLRPNTCAVPFTSPHHVGTLLSHIIIRRVNKVR